MDIGISTSCLYPMETEKAALMLAQSDTSVAEVFFNTFSEIQENFLEKLKGISEKHSMRIISLHPCTSFAEPFCLFGNYERRFCDTLAFYRRYFEAAKYLGAKILVLHGDLKTGVLSEAEYFKRYELLMNEGAKQGIILAQENVNRYRSESPEFMLRMKAAFGSDFHMVFDVKQAVRAGYNPLQFAQALSESIVHVHINDHTAEKDCLPPGKGSFDFLSLFNILHAAGYGGDFVIELYRKNYTKTEEIHRAKLYLKSILEQSDYRENLQN